MARVTKTPDERKSEITDAAQQLFVERGFAQTKVSDIVKKIGVSQGVFYYYFTSKDEIVDEIINRYIQQIIQASLAVIENPDFDAVKKLEKMSDIQMKINLAENNNIHSIKGVDIHEKILKRLVIDYAPLMQKAYRKNQKRETLFLMEIFLTAGNVLFDPGIFQWSREDKNERITFLIDFMEKSLKAPKGSFSFYKKLMGFTA